MKRIFALVLSFAVLFSCLVLPAGAMFDPTPVYQVQAQSAYIVNTDTNIIVYDKDSTKQVSAGGLTKYMTIALLLTNYADHLDDTFQMPFAISDYVYNTNNADMRSNETIQLGALTHVTGDSDDLAVVVVFLQPGNDDGGVQTAGISQHYFFDILLFHNERSFIKIHFCSLMQASLLHPLSAVRFGWFYYTPCGFFVNAKNRQTLGGFARRFGSNCIFMQFKENIFAYYAMQMYILMQSAGAPAGPFGQAAQNADERRRAVCRAALRVSSVSGVGAAVGVTVRPLAPPLGELLSGCEAERASTPTNTQKGSGSRSQEPLPAVLWGM